MLKRALVFDGHLSALGGTEKACARLAEVLTRGGWETALTGLGPLPRARRLDRLFGSSLSGRVRVGGDWRRLAPRAELVVNASAAHQFPALGARNILWLHYLPARRPLAGWTLLANSARTRAALKARWGLEAGLLEPPVDAVPPLIKERLIVGVGRLGDGKGELEMLRVFSALWRAGRLPGWEFVWAAPAPGPTAGEFRRLAEGVPARLRVSAPWREHRSLLGRAAAYWGRDGETFGLAAQEARSARAVVVSSDWAGRTLRLVGGKSCRINPC
ncbi:MAG: hypothetical protein HY928_15295 [Elusimicrobia bacterium]|nr:hypothetical protein [Elusimicrobiota bacterium]